MWPSRAILLGAIFIWLSGCTREGLVLQTRALSPSAPLNDRAYTSVQDLPTPQFLAVEVNIAPGQIVALRLQQHPAWEALQDQELLLHRVLERQATPVDALREEGSEQDAVSRAIEDSLYKAQREAPLRP